MPPAEETAVRREIRSIEIEMGLEDPPGTGR
jgi:hypothetical protein